MQLAPVPVMWRSTPSACIALLIALLSASAALSFAPLPPRGVDLLHITARPMLATELIGMELRDATGVSAGTVADVVLDVKRNRVAHALASLSGELFAVPLFDLRLSLERDYLRLRPNRAGVRPASDAPGGPAISAWVGKELYDKAGEPLGVLDDALVDVHDGEVAFVLLRRGGTLHPLPLDAIAQRAGGLVVQIGLERLDARRSFSPATLNLNLENDDFLRAHAAYADRLTVGR